MTEPLVDDPDELDEDYVPQMAEIREAYKDEDEATREAALRALAPRSGYDAAAAEAMERREIEHSVRCEETSAEWRRMGGWEGRSGEMDSKVPGFGWIGRSTGGGVVVRGGRGGDGGRRVSVGVKRTRSEAFVDKLCQDLVSSKGLSKRVALTKRKGVKQRLDDSMLRVMEGRGKGGDVGEGDKVKGKKEELKVRDEVVQMAKEVLEGGLGEVRMMQTVRFGGQTMEVERVVQVGSAAEKALLAEKEKEEKRRERREKMRERRQGGAKSGGGGLKGAVEVGKEVVEEVGDLKSALASLEGGDVKQVSTLEKSSADWDKFKREQGITDDVARAAKRTAFVDKQSFLESAKAAEEAVSKSARKTAYALKAEAERREDGKLRPSRRK